MCIRNSPEKFALQRVPHEDLASGVSDEDPVGGDVEVERRHAAKVRPGSAKDAPVIQHRLQHLLGVEDQNETARRS